MKNKIKTIKVKVGHPTNTKGAFSFEIRSTKIYSNIIIPSKADIKNIIPTATK